jgi:hypothetical protein
MKIFDLEIFADLSVLGYSKSEKVVFEMLSVCLCSLYSLDGGPIALEIHI